jgi:hypothetical protein
VYCLERHRDSLSPPNRFCYGLCFSEPDGCEAWCDTDPEAAYNEIVSLLVDSEQPLETRTLDEAMQRLVQ